LELEGGFPVGRGQAYKHAGMDKSCGLAAGDLEQYHTQGFIAFKPCSLVTGQLDAAARFTLYLAGKVARSLKPMPKLGDGYHFPELGITRSWIQDGFMNAWKESQAVHEIAINEEVRRAIAQLHGGRVAWPIQTKNWLIGSMTPAHADIIFYDTLPRRGLLVGTWVALEDINASAGPLLMWPASHKASLWDMEAIGLAQNASKSKTGGDTANDTAAYPYARSGPLRSAYTRYATSLHRKLQSSNLPPPVPMLICKGTMLVWAANTIHGGANVTDFTRTRHSITTHYLLEGFEKVWNPLSSVGASKLVASAAVVIPHTQTPLAKPLTASDGKVPERILAAHWRKRTY